jgi:hypothetical protein
VNLQAIKSIGILLVIIIVIPLGITMLVWKDNCKVSVLSELSDPTGNLKVLATMKECKPYSKPAIVVSMVSTEDGGDTSEREVLLYPGNFPPKVEFNRRNVALVLPKGTPVVKHAIDFHGYTIAIVEN